MIFQLLFYACQEFHRTVGKPGVFNLNHLNCKLKSLVASLENCMEPFLALLNPTHGYRYS